MRTVIFAASFALCMLACKPTTTPSDDAAKPTPLGREALARMAAMTLGDKIDEAELTAATAAVARDPNAVDGFIRRLVDDPRMADVAAAITFKQTYSTDSYAPWKGYILKVLPGRPADEPIYFHKDECKPAQAVEVHPWWAMEKAVKVCPEAYQPEQKQVAILNAEAHAEAPFAQCSSMYAAAQKMCGCGPNLQRCTKDEAQRETMRQATNNEIRETVADLIARDRPIAELFTANETVRDRWSEAMYRTSEVDAGFPARFDDLATFRDGFARTPRPELAPGQHAGLLTAPKLLTYNANHRGKLMQYFELLWCSKHVSKGVEPELVLGLGGSNKERKHAVNLEISNEGWEEISTMPACTGCHARMDYGVQFWLGYDNYILGGMHFMPKLMRKGNGSMYGANIDDRRTEGALNPATFARLATSEPEFAGCMVENVTTAILGDTAGDADIVALKAAYQERPTFKSLMSVALRRYADRAANGGRATDAPIVVAKNRSLKPRLAADSVDAEKIAIGPELVKLLENECIACHEEGLFDEAAKTMTRDKAARSLEQVAFEKMPRDKLLDPGERNRVVQLFIDRLWHEPTKREEAKRYYVERMRPRTVLPIASATRVIRGTDDATVTRAAERGLYPENAVYTPGFAAITAIEAMGSCKKAGHVGEALQSCFANATTPASFFR